MRLLLALLAIALITILGSFLYLQHWAHSATGDESQLVMLNIPPGTSTETIAQDMEDAGIVSSVFLMKAWLASERLFGEHYVLQAGEYELTRGLSPAEAIGKLARGEVVKYVVTIPEGLTSREITAILNADERLTGELPEIPEGTLLPETYQIHRGDTRQSVVNRMREAQQILLDQYWEGRDLALPYSSVEAALIMASVIEKETGVDGERDHIAGVFLNRLKQGMPLQSDPTVVYGIEIDSGPMTRPLYRSDWKRDHAWNTYSRSGLPATPICHPGKAAIEAAFNPLATRDLYFVATGSGGHYFARTLAEHNRNIAKYRKTLEGNP